MYRTGGLRRRALAFGAAVIAAPGGATLVVPAAVGGMGLVAAAAVLAPPPADAAVYTVDACQHADGVAAETDGWGGSAKGSPYTYFQNNCAGGGGLDASFDTGMDHASGTESVWSVSAPAGTSLAGISALRASSVGPNQPYGSPTAVTFSSKGLLTSCGSFEGCFGESGEFAVGLSGASGFSFGIQCGGGGTCAAGTNAMTMRRIALSLSDESSPAIAGTPSGSLLSPTTTARVRTVNFSATDGGSGLYLKQLVADGNQVVHQSVFDDNGGRCSTYGTSGHFNYLQPCRLSAAATLSYDTSALSDGPHELTLKAFDAALNGVSYGPFPTLVDNTPPTVSGVNLTGTAVVGQSLSCAATVLGQSPTVTYKWFRASADGSDEDQISGATSSSYTLTSADALKKVLCAVVATDGGGTTTAKTTVTTPPFNSGKTVAAAESDRPTQAVSGAGSGGAANGANAGAKAVVTAVWIKGGRTRLTTGYNSQPSLRGKVKNAVTGEPISDALLDVLVTPAYPGAKPLQMTGVKTRTNGTFLVKLPLGVSSRRVQLIYRSTVGAADIAGQAVLSLTVRAGVSLRSVSVLGRNLTLRGRLAGGPYPATGPIVEIQVRKGASWQVFGTGRADRKGQFVVRYRASEPFPARQVFTFRARVRPATNYPYAGGTSAPRRVAVR